MNSEPEIEKPFLVGPKHNSPLANDFNFKLPQHGRRPKKKVSDGTSALKSHGEFLLHQILIRHLTYPHLLCGSMQTTYLAKNLNGALKMSTIQIQALFKFHA